MDNSKELRSIYYNMIKISDLISELEVSMDSLEEMLNDSFTINNKYIESDRIKNNINNVSELKTSVESIKRDLLRKM